MEKPGREKEVRGKKRDGQQRKEKGKDGNGKNERIYPLENILFDTNIRPRQMPWAVAVTGKKYGFTHCRAINTNLSGKQAINAGEGIAHGFPFCQQFV